MLFNTNIQNNLDYNKNKISIITPCHNEEKTVQVFYNKILEVISKIKSKINKELEYEIIFIDDGSKDSTSDNIKQIILKDKFVHLIKFSRNFGKEAAILSGFNRASGNACVLIDTDMQDPPELIFEMYKIWYTTDIKIVYARRKNRDGEGFIKSKLSDLFYKTSNFVSSVKIKSGVRDFRLMDIKIVKILIEMNEYHRFSKAMFEWVGFKKECLEYEYIPRVDGETSWNYIKLFNYAIEGIISFSTMPLKISFYLGIFISLLSGVYGFYIIFNTLINGNDVKGYPSLITIILFLGGVQLIFIGVIGQYVARIYEQNKNRPHYIIEEII